MGRRCTDEVVVNASPLCTKQWQCGGVVLVCVEWVFLGVMNKVVATVLVVVKFSKKTIDEGMVDVKYPMN